MDHGVDLREAGVVPAARGLEYLGQGDGDVVQVVPLLPQVLLLLLRVLRDRVLGN